MRTDREPLRAGGVRRRGATARHLIGCTNYNAPQMGSVHLIDSSGRRVGAAVALPGVDGWYPTGLAGSAGMVLSQLPPYGNHGNQQEIWNPLTDRVVHAFANADLLGASGNTVVWETAAPYCMTGCSLHVLNVRNGSQRTVRLPSGVTATGDAAISPDGTTIAITGALGGTSRVPYPQAILLIGTRTRVAKVLAGSEQATTPTLDRWPSHGQPTAGCSHSPLARRQWMLGDLVRVKPECFPS